MLLKKNKKGEMMNIFLTIIIFNFICMIVLLFSYIFIAVGNDYMVYEVQVAGLQTYDYDNIDQAFEDAGDSYEAIGWGFIDYIMGFNILIFIITSFATAYRIKSLNYFSWVSILFYGNMILLFILSIMEEFTNWFYEILLALLPNFNFQLPIFNWWLSNIGITALLMFCGILLINIIDFDLNTLFNRKKKEEQVLNDEII